MSSYLTESQNNICIRMRFIHKKRKLKPKNVFSSCYTTLKLYPLNHTKELKLIHRRHFYSTD